jgi:hypothetical protein
MVMCPTSESAEEPPAQPPRMPVPLRCFTVLLAVDELGARHCQEFPEAVLERPVPAALVEPGDDVEEDGIHVLVGLAGGEAVPHPRVELDGFVGAGGPLVQRAAHLWVCHRVGLAVQDEERQLHLLSKHVSFVRDKTKGTIEQTANVQI